MDLARVAYQHYAVRHHATNWRVLTHPERDQIRTVVRLLERYHDRDAVLTQVALAVFNAPCVSALDAQRQAMLRDLLATVRVYLADGQSDDLTLVAGIGPQLEALLNDAGIRTFADLAEVTPSDAYLTSRPMVTAWRLRRWASAARKLMANRGKVTM